MEAATTNNLKNYIDAESQQDLCATTSSPNDPTDEKCRLSRIVHEFCSNRVPGDVTERTALGAALAASGARPGVTIVVENVDRAVRNGGHEFVDFLVEYEIDLKDSRGLVTHDRLGTELRKAEQVYALITDHYA